MRRSLVAAVLLTMAGSSRAIAPKGVGAPLFREKVVVSLVGHATWLGGDSEDVGDASSANTVGESATLWYGAGEFLDGGRPEPSFQNKFTGMPLDRLLSEVPGSALYVWRADAHVIEAGSEGVTIELTWRRYHSDRPGHPRVEAGDTRRFTLAQHARHIIDFIDVPWSTSFRNLSMAVRVDVQEDEKFAGSRIGYDVWLVQGRGESPEKLGRLTLSGKQGESVEARFPEVRYDLPDATFKDGRHVDCVAELSLVVQGRRRPDGTIDVWFGAGRHIGVAGEGDRPRGGTGDGGNKTFTVKPGETVALELPTPGGGHTDYRDEAVRKGVRHIDFNAIPTTPNTSTPGLILTEESVGVMNEPFFADKPMSLLLTVTVDR